MSQQGERRTANEDEWWDRLYDTEPAPDTGAGAARGDDDTVDARFDSATDTLSPPSHATKERQAPPTPAEPPPPARPEPQAKSDPPPPAQAPPPAEAPAEAPQEPPWWAASRPTGAVQKRQPRQATEPPLPSAPPPGAPQPPPPELPPPPTSEPRDPEPQAPPARRPDPSTPAPRPPEPPAIARQRAPWEPPDVPQVPPARREPAPPPSAPTAPRPPGPPARRPEVRQAAPVPPQPVPTEFSPAEGFEGGSDEGLGEQERRPRVGFVGDRPPTYDAEPTALPVSDPRELGALVADTVLDGARYGTYTLRAASVRGDSARYRGEPRRDALLTARFGRGEDALVLVAVAGGVRTAGSAHLAAADACRWIGEAVGRSHARLADDIRAGRRGDLKSGLHRLTDRGYGKLRARASELGLEPEEYTVSLRCLLLPADPACRTRVFFGIGDGGLFRLRGGAWQDIEPPVPEPAAVTGAPVVGFGSPPSGGFGSVPSETPEGDRLTMDLGIPTPPSPYVEIVPPPTEPFRFRASVARPGDTLLLCSGGLADPLRGESALAKELAERWAPAEPPGLAEYLADTCLRVKGYADDRTAVAVWEA